MSAEVDIYSSRLNSMIGVNDAKVNVNEVDAGKKLTYSDDAIVDT